jgi:hypothetical protein
LDILKDLVDVRVNFTKKYFMLHITDGQTDVNTNEKKHEEFIKNLKTKDMELMTLFFEKKKQLKEIRDIDSIETSQIFLQMLIGVCAFQIHMNKKTLIPTDQQFEDVKTDLKKLVEIFYNGIKSI